MEEEIGERRVKEKRAKDFVGLERANVCEDSGPQRIMGKEQQEPLGMEAKPVRKWGTEELERTGKRTMETF